MQKQPPISFFKQTNKQTISFLSQTRVRAPPARTSPHNTHSNHLPSIPSTPFTRMAASESSQPAEHREQAKSFLLFFVFFASFSLVKFTRSPHTPPPIPRQPHTATAPPTTHRTQLPMNPATSTRAAAKPQSGKRKTAFRLALRYVASVRSLPRAHATLFEER